jgi:hypothetical protein
MGLSRLGIPVRTRWAMMAKRVFAALRELSAAALEGPGAAANQNLAPSTGSQTFMREP